VKEIYLLRKASLADVPILKKLIEISAQGLSKEDYTYEQIKGALQGAFGVDTQLIEDGTYFAAVLGEEIIGCGGWSKRKTLFGGDNRKEREPTLLDPKIDSARIRAFFVHPNWARRGIAKAILERSEVEAKALGFKSLELMSTLPGVKFYSAQGFISKESMLYKLPSGINIEFVPMRKELR
jgi:GNAT superfamily N-acetyltransferase